MKKLVLALLVVFFSLQVMSQNIQHTGNFSGTIIKRVTSDYLIYLPEEYSDASRELWPMLVFLHGSGERGSNLDLVKVHGPAKLIEQGKKFPFIVLSPQCPASQDFDTETIFSLIEHIVKEYHVDMDRIYVTGLSMGGGATWDLAMSHPFYFAAIAPVCGRVNRNYPERAGELKHLPIWAFHGAKDDIVPINEQAALIDKLQQAGSKAKFTIYPTCGHDSWTETYDNPDLYEWLLKQRRGQPQTD